VRPTTDDDFRCHHLFFPVSPWVPKKVGILLLAAQGERKEGLVVVMSWDGERERYDGVCLYSSSHNKSQVGDFLSDKLSSSQRRQQCMHEQVLVTGGSS
jgi:hypothetical protein